MLVRFLRCLLIALIGFGLFAGTTTQATQLTAMHSTVSAISTEKSSCNRMAGATTPDVHASTDGAPCKSVTPGCVKQMTCLQTLALPERSARPYRLMKYARLAYWSGLHVPSGLDHEPDLFPPICD